MNKLKDIKCLFLIFMFNFLNFYCINIFYKSSPISLKAPKFTLGKNVVLIIFIIFYFAVGLCIFLSYKKGNKNLIYFVFLAIKTLWGYLFLVERLYGLSFLLLVMIVILCTYIGIKFLKVSKILSLVIFLYSLWLIYFCILNFFIWMYNEM